MKNKKFDDALLHVGVNNLPNYEIQNLLHNLKQIGLKCKSAGVRILIFGIAVINNLASAYISSINQRIPNKRRDNSFVFNNIPTSSLFCESLPLLEIGKSILANNFVGNVNNFLRIRKTQRPPP